MRGPGMAASVDQADIATAPASLSMEEAASIPLVGLTAWQALVDIAKVKKGQKVFIQAGSGGVGAFAIQLAKHLGAEVATTTSAANVEMVKALGADVVIDYRNQDFEKVLSGYDVVLNSQDNETLKKSIGILKPGGHCDFHLRPARSRLCPGPEAQPGDRLFTEARQLGDQESRQARRRPLHIPVHVCQWQPAGKALGPY